MRICWLTVKNFHLKRRRKTNRIFWVWWNTHTYTRRNNGRTCRSENAEVLFPFLFFASAVFSSNIFFFLLVPLGTGTLLCVHVKLPAGKGKQADWRLQSSVMDLYPVTLINVAYIRNQCQFLRVRKCIRSSHSQQQKNPHTPNTL